LTGALAVAGWTLMGVAVVMWLAVLAVPFLPVFEGRRTVAFLGLWLGGEALFAIGALLAAPALLKSHWLRRLLGRDKRNG
jgi:hypothetical protein